MITAPLKNLIFQKFQKAGIEINGNAPWDFQVHDERFFRKVAFHGSLGLGESYMDGWFDTDQLDTAIQKIVSANLDTENLLKVRLYWQNILQTLLNKQTKRRAKVVGKKHYDLGNDLFQCMLDKRKTYSCGYWKNAKNLDEAQEAKLDLICRKLQLKPGKIVLDIGCGWGSFLKFAAENYGVKTVGITISKKQLEEAQEICRGYPIEIRFQDYRDLNEEFDYIVSVGQMEHVGYKNYRTYMEIANKCLKDDGLFLLHTIGANLTVREVDPWIEKYIFPNGKIPSLVQLAKASEGLFILEDLHNFGADYDKTLMAWFHNFESNWPKLKSNYDERFFRMWKYYLLACAGAFRSRCLQLWQFVYSKRGVPGGYMSFR